MFLHLWYSKAQRYQPLLLVQISVVVENQLQPDWEKKEGGYPLREIGLV